MSDIVKATKNKKSEQALFKFLSENNLRYVDKRPQGGCLWIACNQNQTDAINYIFPDLGLYFTYTSKGGKAIGHCPSCYSRETSYTHQPANIISPINNYGNDEAELMRFLNDNGISCYDKRPQGGCLWIVCTSQLAGALNLKFTNVPYTFCYAPKGGHATDHKPAAYTVAKEATVCTPLTTTTQVQQPQQTSPQISSPKTLPLPQPIQNPLEPVVIPEQPHKTSPQPMPSPAKTGASGCLVACVAMIAIISLICLI